MTEKNTSNPDEQNLPIVMVVDDEKAILMSLQRTMRKMPWRVVTSQGGRQALSFLESTKVSVVIADYQMPEMNGIEFLNEVKRRWPDIQRVMLTGAANLGVIEQAVNESEVYRFLNKPWSDSQLKATVMECIDRIHLEESNQNYRRELAARNEQLQSINRDLEKKVQERTAALLHAEKMAALGRMAGGVAHEINNPLGGILAFTQVLLRDDDGDPSRLEALEAIQTCSIRCKTIVDNLLSFSRKPAVGALAHTSMNQVVDGALGIARLHPKARFVEVQVELEDDEVPLLGQSSLLQQVVVNLLQNAFQASQDGDVVLLRTYHDSQWAVLEVKDEGKGISEQDLPHIFEPFFTTKETGEGTGLGLSICYGIVKEHDGKLEVESQEGQGALFRLRLPLVKEDKETDR